MVTESGLLGRKYSFKHISIEVIEKDEEGNVHVFCATFVKATIPGKRISEGLKEMNKTLWDQSSPKRPPGYWLFGQVEKNGVAKNYFVSEEWLDSTPKVIRNAKRLEWKEL